MIDDTLSKYLINIYPKHHHALLEEMEQYALENKVPIMEQLGIETLLQLLRIDQPRSILEVGTAIGYSAIRMSMTVPNAMIVTLERDEERYQIAQQYVNQYGTNNIHILLGDALEQAETVSSYGPFDLIFIDAAKGQYQKFFELFEKMLSHNGMIITDNVLFKGLVGLDDLESIEQKRIRTLVKKIKEYNTWLMQLENYDTVILPIGDGIAISKKKEVNEI